MELGQYLRVIANHWRLVAVSVLACAVAGAAVAWTATPVYAAGTQLFVAAAGAPDDPSQTYQGGLFSQQRVLSYAKIVSGPAITERVIRRLQLDTTPEELESRIRARVPLDTVLLDITVKDTSPQRASAIADAVALEFSRYVNTLESRPGNGSPVKATITRQALMPTSPVAPRKPLYVGFGIFVGLVLGCGAALLRDALDTRVRTRDHAGAAAGAVVLGPIVDDPSAEAVPLVVVDDPLSLPSESYRQLRTNVRALIADQGLRSIVITSPSQGEGKSLITANLGLSFAQAGLRVILVDGDLRRPRLTELMGSTSAEGITHVLAGTCHVDQALWTWRAGFPLQVLGTGPPVRNPSELLGSKRFLALLDALGSRADIVLLDAPALLPVTDAAILARITSGAILVARYGSTRADQLESSAELLRTVNANLLGVVVNRAPARGLAYSMYAPAFGDPPPRTSPLTAPLLRETGA